MSEKFRLFTTVIGSHIWQMNRPDSDLDLVVVYMMDSKDVLLNKYIKGKQTQKENIDTVYYEISHVINNLLKGNCNYLWAVMSPIVKYEYKSAFRELREIVSTNLAKNAFYSINGLSTHNIYHFIEGTKREEIELEDDYSLGYISKKEYKIKKKKWTSKSREIDPKSNIYKKKLNVIGRTLQFGINLLVWGKCMFEKVDIKKPEELWELKNQLNGAYKNSHLPEKPDPGPFEKYLIKWRLHKLQKDGLI